MSSCDVMHDEIAVPAKNSQLCHEGETPKWLKRSKSESGLVSVVVFLLFSAGIIWMVVLEDNQSYPVPWANLFRLRSISANIQLTPADDALKMDIESLNRLKIASLRGHLACFSESGKWVYNSTPRHLPWNYVGDTFASTCDGRHRREGSGHVFGDEAENIARKGDEANWLVREELKWEWQTNNTCPWKRIDVEDFCKQIGSNAHVMVVGDSLNHEISWSLMNALITNVTQSKYEHLSSNNRSVVEPYAMCEPIFGNGKGFMVSFVRNDRLTPIINATVDTWRNFYEFPWLHLLDKHGIKWLLLNRGAHYEDDEIYTKALRDIFTILRVQYPHIQVIYRNTQPGHMNCTTFIEPLLKPQQDFPSNWHWQDFHKQNLLAKQIVEEFGYIYMDVYTMLSLRPEGHINNRDCLHYCIPGPLDLVVEYLYNILVLFNLKRAM